MEVHLAHNQEVVGSNPTPASNEVITMRGSRIAKEIEQEIRREQARREKILEVLRRKRGESNGKRTEFNTNGLENATRETRDIEKGADS